MKYVTLALCFIGLFASGQQKFQVIQKDSLCWDSGYNMVDESKKVVGQLLYPDYKFFWSGNPAYFAVGYVAGFHGWTAIDINKKVLFDVYNAGEFEPDVLYERKIRIIKGGKIGFADEKGNIVIQPKFDSASMFNNGHAIIGTNCKKKPWSDETSHGDCNHYSIVCASYGYIDISGNIIEDGFATPEEAIAKAKWESPY